MGPSTRAWRLLAALLLLLPLAGCVKLDLARVPDKLLEGPGGNGWEKNMSASQQEATSTGGGTSKSQTLVYEDRRSREGYPGTLTVTSLRTLIAPNDEKVLRVVDERIREEAQRKGIAIQGAPAKGTRQLANGEEGAWFVYSGKVSASGFFSRDTEVKIFGEVSHCGKTLVAVVGLAQVTDVRSVGGVPLPSDPDPQTWREMVSDPRGSIEGHRGSAGLAYNVAC